MQPFIAGPVTLLIVLRAYRRKSLTIPACITAALTAVAHALHPSALPFTLLFVFFLLGTQATKVKHDIKAGLTLSSSGHSGGDGARTPTQVLANSACASVLCLLHVFKYGIGTPLPCYGEDHISDLLLIGVVCNYLSVTADTLSSELGILSASKPRLITNPFRTVPQGTNGGVTLRGIWYGYLGSLAIAATSIFFIPFCAPKTTMLEDALTKAGSVFRPIDKQPYNFQYKASLVLALSAWGAIGSLLDSLLGALLQASVIDRRSGKIVEGPGGIKVLTTPAPRDPLPTLANSPKPTILKSTKTGKEVELKPKKHERQHSREISSGRDVLDNNQINFLMASTMTIWGMGVAATAWGVDLDKLIAM